MRASLTPMQAGRQTEAGPSTGSSGDEDILERVFEMISSDETSEPLVCSCSCPWGVASQAQEPDMMFSTAVVLAPASSSG